MKYVAPVGAAAGAAYVDGDPASGVEGSAVPAAAIEHPMREIEALIEDCGLTPSASSLTQVSLAVRRGLQKMSSATSIAGGSEDALDASFTPAVTELSNGMRLRIRAALANLTTTPTFTPAAGTVVAKPIVKGAGAALVVGDIAGPGHWLVLQYDVTLDKWVLLNPAKGVTTQVGSVGTTYSNVTGSRSVGVVYTNTSGRPLHVIVEAQSYPAVSAGISLSVGGVVVSRIYSQVATGTTGNVSAVIPSGATYQVNWVGGSGTLNNWSEL